MTYNTVWRWRRNAAGLLDNVCWVTLQQHNGARCRQASTWMRTPAIVWVCSPAPLQIVPKEKLENPRHFWHGHCALWSTIVLWCAAPLLFLSYFPVQAEFKEGTATILGANVSVSEQLSEEQSWHSSAAVRSAGRGCLDWTTYFM